MSIIDNLSKRLDLNNDSDNYQFFNDNSAGLLTMQKRLNARGGTDQWTRMREDKLRSLKKALLFSYQSAIVQEYDVLKNNKAKKILQLITKMQNLIELDDTENIFLTKIEQEYNIEDERGSYTYIQDLQNVMKELINATPLFRCLINHDKLKVDYEDKIISIPFSQPPIGGVDPIETNFHNGTVFKWVHGNKQEWTPDTYWIVYMQYSEQTAYFRAEIRKADEQIQIITVDQDGNESTTVYRGWMTGPNETSILWNVKKGVAWNDMNYTKLLYITKDENTLTFFQRFDRVIINGKPWQIQAYNENYSTTKRGNIDSGIIRVALKETYTSSTQFMKETLQAIEADKQAQNQYDLQHPEARIDGPTTAYPFSILTFVAKNFEEDLEWSISDSRIAKIKAISADTKTATVQILTGFSNKDGFDINYGSDDNTKIHVIIKSF